VIVNAWLPYRQGRTLPLRIGLPLALIPIVFSVALSRFGQHLIFTLPPLPVVGGAWTWEAVLFGASSGVALLLTIAVFGVLTATIRSADLIGLLPAPLYRAGTAFALSLAFAPKTVASFQSIREARQLRGQASGWRSVPTLILPLMLTSLEQALQYGESLDARGYGSRRRSRYRRIPWKPPDVLCIAASIASLLLTILGPMPAYNPYVQLAPPPPSFASAAAMLLLATPALLAAASWRFNAPD
jgi:energy-coupling factor transport system permease protein